MILDGLKDLYYDMKKELLKRYKFGFSYNGVAFDVFFFIDEQPFKLMFGVKVRNFYFELDVNKGFEINPFLGEKYTELCRILNLTFNENSPFKTTYFFEEFNKRIPRTADKGNYPKPHEIGVYRKEIEEADKIYFLGWQDNEKKGQQVSEENLDKTRKLLGFEAYKRCRTKNISSRWTDNERFAKEFYMP